MAGDLRRPTVPHSTGFDPQVGNSPVLPDYSLQPVRAIHPLQLYLRKEATIGRLERFRRFEQGLMRRAVPSQALSGTFPALRQEFAESFSTRTLAD